MAGVEVDDAEAAHSDAAGSVDVETLVIGAAMAYRIAHGADAAERGVSSEQKLTRDAAHTYLDYRNSGAESG